MATYWFTVSAWYDCQSKEELRGRILAAATEACDYCKKNPHAKLTIFHGTTTIYFRIELKRNEEIAKEEINCDWLFLGLDPEKPLKYRRNAPENRIWVKLDDNRVQKEGGLYITKALEELGLII